MVRLNPAAVTVRGSYRDTYAAFGPPQSGKSMWMAQAALEAPGACLLTSTRADLARDTAKTRARSGPVWFLNPGLDGGFPSTLRFSPLAGCEDQRAAIEAAGALMSAAPHDPSGRDAHWDGLSRRMLQFLMHAAALTPGADILTVQEWASNPALAGEAAGTLLGRDDPRWGRQLVALVSRSANDERYWSAISSGVTQALSWLDDPALADLACPLPGEQFSARQFIRDRGAAYLIGADSEHCPLSAYFACLAGHVWGTAKAMAADPAEEASVDLRLDPPLMMIIDEPMITCPVPLDRWVTEAAGHGITLVTGFQSDAQPPQRFGAHGGQALEDMFTVKLVFRGVTGAIAEKASKWAGDRDTWHGSRANLRQERAFPPERICNLPLGSVLVKHRGTRAFIAEIGRVEEHPLYERAQPSDFPAPPRVRAVTAPSRPALAVSPEGEVTWPAPETASSAA